MFNGLVVYWSVYYEADNKAKEKNNQQNWDTVTTKSAKQKYGNTEDPFVLIDKFQIPKEVDSQDDAKVTDVKHIKETTSIDRFIFGEESDIHEVDIDKYLANGGSLETTTTSTGSSIWNK